MLFASFFDVSIAPFYAFSALVAMTRQSGWKTILPNQDLVTIFSQAVFLMATIGGGLHLVSLAIGLYLAVTFRKITALPPDMNPLEDNLTSRHKRNKSSVSTVMSSNTFEKGISLPLESKQASGAAYEDLSRPPTIPFFHTRTQSTTSFSTYKSTPPPSRDSRIDLPSRQYQAVPSNRSSLNADQLKRNSGSSFTSPPKRAAYIDLTNPRTTTPFSPSSPPKRAAYTEVPMSDTSSINTRVVGEVAQPWFASDSIGKARTRSSPAKKAHYQPLHQHHGSEENVSIDVVTDYSSSYDLPNPLEAHPPTARHNHPFSRDSPLSELSSNAYGRGSGDIADIPISAREREQKRGNERDLISSSRQAHHQRQKSRPKTPLQSQAPAENTVDTFKAKHYGELKPGTPPIMVGGKNSRQVSSGNDFLNSKGGFRVDRRDVSGKIAEEGRGGNGGAGWGTRLRKVSGL